MIVLAILLVAGVYGLRRGAQDARKAVQQSVKDWGSGKALPDSPLARRLGQATGGFTVHAWRGQKAFRKSAREGFWEGAEQAWTRIEQNPNNSDRVRRAARSVGKHANTWRAKRARKRAQRLADQGAAVPPQRPEPATSEPPQRPTPDQPNPKVVRDPVTFLPMILDPETGQLVRACRNCGAVLDDGPHRGPVAAAERKRLEEAAQEATGGLFGFRDRAPGGDGPMVNTEGATCAKCSKESVEHNSRIAGVTPEAIPAAGATTEKEHNTMAAEITVGELLTYVKGEADDGNIVDQATEIATQAEEQASAALTMADRAQAAEFKDDVTGPLAEVADAKQAIADAAKTFLCAADAHRAAMQAAATSLEAHSVVVDAAAGLSGGTASMAHSEAYAE